MGNAPLGQFGRSRVSVRRGLEGDPSRFPRLAAFFRERRKFQYGVADPEAPARKRATLTERPHLGQLESVLEISEERLRLIGHQKKSGRPW